MRKGKRWMPLVLAAAMIIGMIPGLPAAAAAETAGQGTYEDVGDGAWYAEAVRYVSEKGLMTGISEKAFGPEEITTRAMIVTILYRQAGSPDVTKENPYHDIEDGKWYTDAVRWASETGVASGYSETEFGPEDPIRREQMAAILFRYAGMQGEDVTARDDLKAFGDAGEISQWAEDAMRWAVAEGLITGVSADTLVPGGTATRAQAAMILMRFLKKIDAISPALVRTVHIYNYDYGTKDWVISHRLDYRYENGYPVQIDTYYPDVDLSGKSTFEYTFENGLPAVRKEYSENGGLISETQFKDGKVYDIEFFGENEVGNGRDLYQYTDGSGYFNMYLFTRYDEDPAGERPGEYMEEVDSIRITTQNGLLKQTLNTGMYANWSEGDPKEWQRFNGTYIANYDEDGILHDTSSSYRAGPPGGSLLFDVTKDNGKITEIVRSDRYPDRDIVPQNKYVFEYTDEAIDPARYANMINDHILSGDNTFYKFNWY